MVQKLLRSGQTRHFTASLSVANLESQPKASNWLGRFESTSLWLTQSWSSQVSEGLPGIFLSGLSEFVKEWEQFITFFPTRGQTFQIILGFTRSLIFPEGSSNPGNATRIQNLLTFDLHFPCFLLSDATISATGRWPRRIMIQLRWCQPKCHPPKQRRVCRWKNRIRNPIILLNQPPWATQQTCLNSWSDASPKD